MSRELYNQDDEESNWAESVDVLGKKLDYSIGASLTLATAATVYEAASHWSISREQEDTDQALDRLDRQNDTDIELIQALYSYEGRLPEITVDIDQYKEGIRVREEYAATLKDQRAEHKDIESAAVDVLGIAFIGFIGAWAVSSFKNRMKTTTEGNEQVSTESVDATGISPEEKTPYSTMS